MTEYTESNGATALSWASLNLNEVAEATAPERTEVPAGTYKLRLVSAKPSPYQAGSTDMDFVITEGPQSKRHIFASLPTPDKGKWVISAASNLIKSLGGEHKSGEDLVDTLNRIAPTSNAVSATVAENNYNDKITGEPKVGRPRVQFFSIQPAL